MGESAPAVRAVDTQLFRDVFNASPIGIAVENLDGQPLFVNPALCSILGFSEEELCGKHCVQFSPPDDAQKDWALFEKLRAGTIDRYQLEKRYFRRDGSLMWGRLSISLLNRGSSPLVLAMVEDVTEKKNTEEMQYRHASIVESSDDAIVSKTLDGVILSWNAGAERLYGYTEAEAIGKPISILVPDELLDEQTRLLDRLRGGVRIDHYETFRISKAGRKIAVSMSLSPIRDSAGVIVGLSGISRDISDRKRQEEKLREYERTIENAEEMIVVVDREYRILIANRQFLKMRNMKQEQVVGHFVNEVLNEGDFKTIVKPKLAECFRGKVVRYEMKNTYPEFGDRDLLVSYFPIEGASGVDRVACFLQDITERKQAEETLGNLARKMIEAQDQERARIARDLHDDVVQRIALVAVELQQMQNSLPNSVAKLRARIRKLHKRVVEVSSSVQTMSHELHSSKLEYLGIVGTARSFCKEFSERQKLEVEFKNHDVPRSLSPEVSLALFRVLQEALHNAAKHSRVRHFQVELWGTSEHIHLAVSDLGVGFDAETAKIGRGLGLTSMKERLRLVNGELTIESRPNRGTTVHARVPFSPKNDAAKMAG